MTLPVEHKSSPNLTLMTEFSAPKRSAILLHQLKALYSETLPFFLVSIVCAGLITLLLWNEKTDQQLLLNWFLSNATACALQIALIIKFKRISKSPFSLRRWHKLFLVGTLINAAHWGYAAFALQSDTLGIVELVATAAVAGLLVYATTVFTMSLSAFFCFALPPILCLLFHSMLWIENYGYPYLIVNIMFSAFLSHSAFHHYKSRTTTLIKALENESLIHYLDNARCMAEKLNKQLSAEISSREEVESELKAAHKTLEQRVNQRTADLTEANNLLNQQVTLRRSISDALLKSQSRLSQAIEASQLGLWDWDLMNGTVYQSAFHDAFQKRELSSVDFISNLKLVVHPQDYPIAKKALSEYLKGDTENYLVQYRICDKDGKWLWIEDCGKTVKTDSDGSPLRMLGTRRNIHSEKKRDEQVRLAKAVFDHTSEGVFVLDENFHFVSVNPAFCKISGYEKSELEGRFFIEVSHTPKKYKVFSQAREQLENEDYWQAELFDKRKNGNYFPVWLQINAIRDTQNDIIYYAGLLSDMSARKEADEKLTYLLNYDDLTGLANRSLFRDRLHNAIVRTRRGDAQFCLMIIDIDRFKQINDSLGHEAGDYLLKEVAQRITTTLTSAADLSDNTTSLSDLSLDTMARLAADEFAVIIKYEAESSISSLAKTLLKALSLPYFVAENELLISCSIGLSLLPKHAQEFQTLLQQATLAAQQAKYLGGNNAQFYSHEFQDFSTYRMTIEKELRKAIKNDELEVFFQPKVNVSTGLIDSAEALVRWRHPSRGLVSPSEFVHIAEDSGLITEIGEFVLLKACQQTKRWVDNNIATIKISVNISAHQLRHNSLSQTVAKILKETQLTERQLELELTESSIMENITAATVMLKKLCAMGISISLDDFGTGYSSLSHLKRFPVDALKIDRSFIRDIETKAEDAAIVKAIIVLGHSLKLKVIAEGVENKNQFDILKQLDCDEAQGYFIAKPLSATDMTQMLTLQRTQSLSFS